MIGNQREFFSISMLYREENQQYFHHMGKKTKDQGESYHKTSNYEHPRKVSFKDAEVLR